MLKSKSGFTIVEAVASIFLITLILTTAMMIIINMRNQATASELRIKATDVGSLVRNDISSHYDYTTISNWLNGNSQILTNNNCSISPISCAIFLYDSGETTFTDSMTLTFLAPTAESINYKIVHYEIEIIYFNGRTITLLGAVYEKA